ncbi:MAG: hypothetical protein U9R28_07625 [Pseudomonadota bacterium]|nr:hypothetical protein [Pseudomonadota bacterium]
MASEDETFDPNDLDSIDALLDEAEMEVSENLGEDPVSDEPMEIPDDFDLPELPDEVSEPEISAAVEDSLPELEPEPESIPEPEVETILTDVAQEAVPAPSASGNSARSNVVAEPEEEFIPKRSQVNKASKNEVSAAEMDAIKKLIIIFGSVLIVLVLTAIGMGVWSAIAASSGLDEETQTMIEDIKAGTEKNTLSNSSNTKTMKSAEKKLDALSFQLEQLTADIATLESSMATPAAANAPAITPIPGVAVPQAQNKGHAAPPVANAQVLKSAAHVPVASPVDNHAVLEKLSVVSSKMAKAQKRIDEVNTRVKSIQSQYSKLMHSVKVVEKQMVDQQAKVTKDKKSDKPNQAHEQPRYQYNTPDAVYYDQSNPDSYP